MPGKVREIAVQPWKVVAYASCPDCPCGSLAVQANGKLVRHSVGFGYVERVGPGTRHPTWKTIICEGSGKRVREPVQKIVRSVWNKR
jgi:hypothetical protein